MRKKGKIVWLAVLALVAILAAVLLLKWHSRSHREAKDTPYPFTWIEQEDGSAFLSIEEDPSSGSVWEISNVINADILVAERTGTSEDGDKTMAQFLLSPIGAGEVSVQFSLIKGEVDAYRNLLKAAYEYAFFINVVVSDKGQVSISGYSTKNIPEELSGELEEAGYALTYTQDLEFLYLILKTETISSEQDIQVEASLNSDLATLENIYHDESAGGTVIVLSRNEDAIYALRENGSANFKLSLFCQVRPGVENTLKETPDLEDSAITDEMREADNYQPLCQATVDLSVSYGGLLSVDAFQVEMEDYP